MKTSTNFLDLQVAYNCKMLARVCIGLALALGMGATFSKDINTRILMGVSGAGVAALGEKLAVQGVKVRKRNNDLIDIEQTVQQSLQLQEAFKPQLDPAALSAIDNALLEPSKYEPFDYHDLDKKAHLLILSESGGGKTTLVRWLVSDVLSGLTVQINPHASEKNFKPKSIDDALNQLRRFNLGEIDELSVGAGRDFEGVTFMLAAINQLMDDRYDLGWKLDHNQLNVIFEEANAVAGNEDAAEQWNETVTTQWRESRKVKIRTVLVSQEKNLESLGLQGSGGLRDGIPIIRLGKTAKDHAKRTLRTKEDKEALTGIVSDLKKHGFCWMVDDEWMPYQDLSAWAEKTDSDLSPEAQKLLTFISERPGVWLKPMDITGNKRVREHHKWSAKEVRELVAELTEKGALISQQENGTVKFMREAK